MKKYYIELDKIRTIQLTQERETDYRWFDEIPAQPMTFLGIKYSMTEKIPAGWNDFYENEINMSHLRRPSSYFLDWDCYRVSAFRIYRKASVTISLGYRESFCEYFESTQEAQAYVDDLLLGLDRKFIEISYK